MSKEKTIINLGSYRLVKLDKYNYEMEEFREPSSDKGARVAKNKEAAWRKMGHYFRSIASGVSWLLEHRMLNEGGEYTLEESVKRYGEIADELRGYVEKATGSK